MQENDHQTGIAEALRFLTLFESVGADAFDITHTNLAGEKRGFRPAQTVDQARESMPYLVRSAARRQNNVILRPRSTTAVLIQLDDLPPENLPKIDTAAFLVLQTSPKGIQAWVAVKTPPAGFAARLKEGLEADREASGATRVAGTWNFKPNYAPDFPVVRILAARPGLVVTAADLQSRGVLAPARPEPPPLPFVVSGTAPRTHKFPDYQRCLDGAPIGTSGNPKRTAADYTWSMIALSWGHSIEATAARLLEVSTKAQENGPAYATRTAERAEYAARERNSRPVGRPAKRAL